MNYDDVSYWNARYALAGEKPFDWYASEMANSFMLISRATRVSTPCLCLYLFFIVARTLTGI
jgi:hypothetical protein